MKRKVRFRMAAAALALTLTVGSVPLAVYADNGASVVEQNILKQESLGTVSLSGGNSIELKQASILASDEGNVASFTLTLHNNSNYEIQFIDYWIRLLNQSGTSFTVQVLPQDKDKNRVAPHSSLDVNLYAKVSGDTDLSDLIFRIVQWDFSAPNYERRLGDIAIPADYSVVTPANNARLVNIGGVDVKMAATKMNAGQNSEFYLPKISFRVENIGVKTVELPAYQFSLRTKEGLLYPLTVKGLEDNNRSLYPRFIKDLELSGKLPLSVGAEDWQLVVTSQLDTGASTQLSLPVAFFALPAPAGTTDETITPVDAAKTIDVGTGSLETRVKQINRTKREASYAVSLSMTLKNTGTGSVALPAYRFAIETAEGLTYPASPEGLQDLVIDPLFQKDIRMTATIPTSVDPADWKLLLLPPADADGGVTNETPIATYKLSDTSAELGGIGQGYDFSNRNGTYTATLNGIQRLPWEDQDILSANLTIANKGTAALPVPDITGYFLLDEAVQVPATALVKDSVISINPGNGQVNVQLYGKIPYTNDYSTIKLVLQEKDGESAVEDLLDFRSNSSVASITHVPAPGSFRLEGVGRRADLSVRDVRTYDAGDSSLFSVQLQVENLEKRHASIGKLVGYLKTSDDIMYPAIVSEVTNKVGANGMGLLNISAFIPKNINTLDFSLILGTGVTDGQLAQTEAPDAYIDAASFTLPSELTTPKNRLTDIDLFPYTFSVSQVNTKALSNSFNLSINYKFSKNHLVEANVTDHRIVLELEDTDNKILISQTYAYDQADGDGKSSLKVGEGEILLESPTYDSFIGLMSTLSKYKLKIYDEFKGQRKLVAEQEFPYFSSYRF